MIDTEITDKGLSKFIKAFKVNKTVIKVGIFGDHNSRSGSDKTNAEIGRKHEYGIGVPRRSFLRMPITEHLQEALNKSGLFDLSTAKIVINSGSLDAWKQKIAIVAEGVVLEAFNSGGYGKWEPSNMAHKKVHQTLVETQQLRNSITSVVK